MRRIVFKTLFVAAVFLFAGGPISSGKVIYVDDDAVAPGDGTSWATAYRFLQDGLAVAEAGDEIRVARGLYRPDRSSEAPEGSGDREASFVLPEGATLKGGFAGLSGVEPDAWDAGLYETALSGDLGADDAALDDPAQFREDLSREDNSLNVVRAGASSVLDGLVITAGHAQPYKCISGVNCPDVVPAPGFHGGGVLIEAANVTVRNSRLHHNFAEYSGGGIFAHETEGVRLEGCVLERNGAHRTGGGGLCISKGTAAIEKCALSGNWAPYGGGLESEDSDIAISDSVIRCNEALYNGGGLMVEVGNVFMHRTLVETNVSGEAGGGGFFQSHVEMRHCRFIGNESSFGGAAISYGELLSESSLYCGNVAKSYGGALYSMFSESFAVRKCTFADNRATAGQFLAAVRHPSYLVAIDNCIVSDGGREVYTDQAGIVFEYTAIAGDSSLHDSADIVWGQGNLEVDPCFVSPGYWDTKGTPDDPNDDFFVEGDYHLKSQAGRWDEVAGSWVQDEVTSPCIDAGDPNSPIMYEPFPNGGVINMGVYGGTAQASKSYFGAPLCETIIAGDINGDCQVDIADVILLLDHWLQTGEQAEE